MARQFTISQLAKAAEIPSTTVRYYERIGLVEPEDRSHGQLPALQQRVAHQAEVHPGGAGHWLHSRRREVTPHR